MLQKTSAGSCYSSVRRSRGKDWKFEKVLITKRKIEVLFQTYDLEACFQEKYTHCQPQFSLRCVANQYMYNVIVSASKVRCSSMYSVQSIFIDPILDKLPILRSLGRKVSACKNSRAFSFGTDEWSNVCARSDNDALRSLSTLYDRLYCASEY